MKCLITFHPAAAIRFQKFKGSFLEDFGVLRRMLQDVPTKR
jgi:uracil-DNA glycosylase